MQTAIRLVEAGWVPDFLVRRGIRSLLKERLTEQMVEDCQQVIDAKQMFLHSEMQGNAPIAPLPEKANEQHYEVPPAFFSKVLGTRRKYSCCEWDENTKTLDQAEENALKTTSERAELHNGQTILELGCGWGSLTLWVAEHYPQSRIVAVSNSAQQREYIMEQAGDRGFSNVTVITADMNEFSIDDTFDRVVSVEMFEHMRNYEALFERVNSWLKPGGKFFMHIFCHRDTVYPFVAKSSSDWMSNFFFSGGIMPSDDLPLRFQRHLRMHKQWRWDGRHYEKTSNAWLALMDASRAEVRKVLAKAYGAQNVDVWWMRWRIFFMSCAELFGYNQGQEWWVSHYLFNKGN